MKNKRTERSSIKIFVTITNVPICSEVASDGTLIFPMYMSIVGDKKLEFTSIRMFGDMSKPVRKFNRNSILFSYTPSDNVISLYKEKVEGIKRKLGLISLATPEETDHITKNKGTIHVTSR